MTHRPPSPMGQGCDITSLLSSRSHAVLSINEQKAPPSSPQGLSAPGAGGGGQFQVAGTWLTRGSRSQSPAGGSTRGSPPQAGRRRRGRDAPPVSPTPHPALAPRTTFHRLGPRPRLLAAPGPGPHPRVWTPQPPARVRTPNPPRPLPRPRPRIASPTHLDPSPFRPGSAPLHLINAPHPHRRPNSGLHHGPPGRPSL